MTLPRVHHHDPVADIANHSQIVANEHISQMKLLLQTLKQVQNLRLYGNIQCGNRLIAKISFGFTAKARTMPICR